MQNMINTITANTMTNISIPSFREKAITVRLRRAMYIPTKYDSAATAAAESSFGAGNVGRYTKRLLKNCTQLKDVQKAFQDVYTYVIDHTLPWMDEGVRVLPNASYVDFAQEVGEFRRKALSKVEKLGAVWDSAVLADKARLGSMWNPMDYPTKEEMLAKWGISVVFSPIPASEDFRIDMDEADRKALDDAIHEVEQSSTGYLLKEMLKPVAAMAAKLSVPIGDEGSIFRDSLMGNLKDVANRAKKLNLNHDARVDEVIADIEKVTNSVTLTALRETTEVRNATAKQMKSLADKINQWF